MKVQVSAQFTRFEDKAQSYVLTERHVKLETRDGETVAAFADRAHDILLPRTSWTEHMTPAQYRKNAGLSLASSMGGFFAEDALVDVVIRQEFDTYFLVLKPRPLVDA